MRLYLSTRTWSTVRTRAAAPGGPPGELRYAMPTPGKFERQPPAVADAAAASEVTTLVIRACATLPAASRRTMPASTW